MSAAIAKQLEKSRRRARAPGSTHFPNETLKHILPDMLSEGHVCSWHKTDMPTVFRDVQFQGQSGKHLLALLLELMTSVHWVKADIAVASVEI